MVKVYPKGETVPGIDVSKYQGQINWFKVKQAGCAFAFAKASERSQDPMFQTNKTNAKAQGLLFAGYHYLHPSMDAIKQAELFLKVASPAVGELPPMLDWETTDNVPTAVDRERALTWLNYIQAKVGQAPILYTGPYFAQALNLTDEFSDFPLYIAHYGTLAPLVPAPWTVWSFHQFTGHGHIDGVNFETDLDRWNGPLENLKKLVIS